MALWIRQWKSQNLLVYFSRKQARETKVMAIGIIIISICAWDILITIDCTFYLGHTTSKNVSIIQVEGFVATPKMGEKDLNVSHKGSNSTSYYLFLQKRKGVSGTYFPLRFPSKSLEMVKFGLTSRNSDPDTLSTCKISGSAASPSPLCSPIRVGLWGA